LEQQQKISDNTAEGMLIVMLAINLLFLKNILC